MEANCSDAASMLQDNSTPTSRIPMDTSSSSELIKRPLRVEEVPAAVWYEGTDREVRGRAICDVGGRQDWSCGHGALSRLQHEAWALALP